MDISCRLNMYIFKVLLYPGCKICAHKTVVNNKSSNKYRPFMVGEIEKAL